ncbi:MAG: hypothetical protein MJ132_00630 [Clostridia bacterium]|nr:hypothetical protein [Clostridia bacterium]
MLRRIFAVLLASVLCFGCFAGAFSVSATPVGEWSAVYEKFIKDKQYLKLGEYDTDEADPYTFALHDLSGDGIPELISYNGSMSEAGAEYNVFGISGGKVVFLGNAGFRIGAFEILADKKYPGLYWCNGNMGQYEGDYYSVQNGKLKRTEVLVEQDEMTHEYYPLDGTFEIEKDEYGDTFYFYRKTEDEQLYHACRESTEKLEEVSVEEILSGSWTDFLAKYGYEIPKPVKHREIKLDADAKYVSIRPQTVPRDLENALLQLLFFAGNYENTDYDCEDPESWQKLMPWVLTGYFADYPYPGADDCKEFSTSQDGSDPLKKFDDFGGYVRYNAESFDAFAQDVFNCSADDIKEWISGDLSDTIIPNAYLKDGYYYAGLGGIGSIVETALKYSEVLFDGEYFHVFFDYSEKMSHVTGDSADDKEFHAYAKLKYEEKDGQHYWSFCLVDRDDAPAVPTAVETDAGFGDLLAGKYDELWKPAAEKEASAKAGTNALKMLLPIAIGVVCGAAALCTGIVIVMIRLRRKKSKK